MKNSAIEWCKHTFNPWSGCAKVSPACAHCYAEALSHRFGNDIWGPNAIASGRSGRKRPHACMRSSRGASATRSPSTFTLSRSLTSAKPNWHRE
jgi:protein gp37